MYELILFDADGTLFDYQKAEKNAFYKTFSFMDRENELERLHQMYKQINGVVWREFERGEISAEKLRVERFVRLLSACATEFPAGKLDPAELSRGYLSFLAHSNELLPSAEDIVMYCAEKYLVSVITNGLQDVQEARIGESVLAEYIDKIFISEEIGYPKPDARIFSHALHQYAGLEKSAVLLVGDNLISDIGGGNDFGIDTCWFNQNKLPNETGIHPRYEIHGLAELKDII
ncbi:MAG: YjjG family noncanonical pyrimidine nucleotidase [Candidatus Cloacimonetes bacterium]|nr:YjjG family noncanonical pyrimidine nucleotidase [Candidatus Cloacimonadota bacterium]